MFVGPLYLLWTELRRFTQERTARIAYLGSMIGLYASISFALHAGSDALLVGVVLAHAWFHAIEYFTLCGWAMQQKRGGVWDRIAPRIVTAVVSFVVLVGLMIWLFKSTSPWALGLFTLWASFLHYGYDGMIWRAPKPRPTA